MSFRGPISQKTQGTLHKRARDHSERSSSVLNSFFRRSAFSSRSVMAFSSALSFSFSSTSFMTFDARFWTFATLMKFATINGHKRWYHKKITHFSALSASINVGKSRLKSVEGISGRPMRGFDSSSSSFSLGWGWGSTWTLRRHDQTAARQPQGRQNAQT